MNVAHVIDQTVLRSIIALWAAEDGAGELLGVLVQGSVEATEEIRVFVPDVVVKVAFSRIAL